jgi:hypothetical protein
LKSPALPPVAIGAAAGRPQPGWPHAHGGREGQYASIECVAGCYDSHADARQAASRVAALAPQAPAPPVVLGPVDAPWLRFMRRSRRWARPAHAAGQSRGSDVYLMSLLGAMAGALLAAAWVLFDDSPALATETLLALSLAAMLGTAVGAVGSLWWRAHPSRRRFDRVLRRHLQAGRWVLVVHDGAAVRQPEVVDAVRLSSRQWCSVSSPRAQI